VSALFILDMTSELWIISASLLCGGFVFFFILSKLGEKLLQRNENEALWRDELKA